MIEINYLVAPIESKHFTNQQLLNTRQEQAEKKRIALIATLLSAGITIAAIIGILTTNHGIVNSGLLVTAGIGGAAFVLFGQTAADAERDLAIINQTIKKRNQYRHPDDQLI